MEEHSFLSIFISANKAVTSKYMDILERKISLHVFENIESSFEYLVKDNLNICFCILDVSSRDIKEAMSFVEKVHRINNLIKIILVEASSEFEKNYKSGIEKENTICYNSHTSTMVIINDISESLGKFNDLKRKYSRVNWPLNVNIKFITEKDMQRIDRRILSISGNGAFICSDDNIPKKGDRLNLNITFKDFKLMTEAIVIWTNEDGARKEYPIGFAVSFVDIGHISQKIIDDIIKDKMLQEILIEMKDV